VAVNLHTTHYRFGVEELLEATHGWHAAEDANPAQGVIANDTTFLLRFNVQETGGTAAGNTDQQFQCRLNGGTWQNITTTSTIVKAVASVAFTNGQDATKRLSGTGTFESSGDGCTEDGLSGGAQNDIAASGCSETECALQIVGADVANNDTIEFRLTSPDFTVTNDVVPTLTVYELTEITGTGALNDGSSAVVGSGLSLSTGSGTPTAQASAVAGVGTSLSAGSGVLTDGSSALAGAGVSVSVGSGILLGQSSSVTGAGDVSSGVSGSGSLVAQPSQVAGEGISASQGQGAPAAQQSTVDGSGVSQSEGSGALPAQTSVVAGAGASVSVGNGVLGAQASQIIGEGNVVTAITGSGALTSLDSTLSGSGESESVGGGILLVLEALLVATGESASEGRGGLVAQNADLAAELEVTRRLTPIYTIGDFLSETSALAIKVVDFTPIGGPRPPVRNAVVIKVKDDVATFYVWDGTQWIAK